MTRWIQLAAMLLLVSCAPVAEEELPASDKSEVGGYVLLRLEPDQLDGVRLVSSLEALHAEPALVAMGGDIAGSSQALLPALAAVPLYYWLGGSLLVVAAAAHIQSQGGLRLPRIETDLGSLLVPRLLALVIHSPDEDLREYDGELHDGESPGALRRTLDWVRSSVGGWVNSNDAKLIESSSPLYRDDNRGRYLVVLSGDDLDRDIARLATEYGARPHGSGAHNYFQTLFRGFITAPLDREAALALSRDSAVRWVEEDSALQRVDQADDQAEMTAPIEWAWTQSDANTDTDECRPQYGHTFVTTPEAPQGLYLIQPPEGANGPSWALDRVDQRELPLDCRYEPAGRGGGVTVYVMDDGVLRVPELGGRFLFEKEMPSDEFLLKHCIETYATHGTPVATMAAGQTLGVANQAQVISVRTMCENTAAAVTAAGIEWVAQRIVSQPHPAVLNLSARFFAPYGEVVRLAALKAQALGVTFVTSAGNQGCDLSTMVVPDFSFGLVVGASDAVDRRAPDSNFGSCVHMYAPGQFVAVPSLTSPDLQHISGTSFAAPMVAGGAAIYLGAHPTANPRQVINALLGAASQVSLGALSPDLGPSRLLYVGAELMAR